MLTTSQQANTATPDALAPRRKTKPKPENVDRGEARWNGGVGAVFAYSQADPTARLVLLAIAHHGDTGPAIPSITRLAAFTGLAPRTVQGAIRRLEQLGELIVEHRAHTSSRYILGLADPRISCGGPPHLAAETPAPAAPELPKNTPVNPRGFATRTDEPRPGALIDRADAIRRQRAEALAAELAADRHRTLTTTTQE